MHTAPSIFRKTFQTMDGSSTLSIEEVKLLKEANNNEVPCSALLRSEVSELHVAK